jgi:hypothetical protein
MKLVAQALLVSRFQKAGAEITMDLDGGTKNRTRARIPTFFLVLPGFYVNRSDALAHLTISSQILLGHEENHEIRRLAFYNGTIARNIGKARPILLRSL